MIAVPLEASGDPTEFGKTITFFAVVSFIWYLVILGLAYNGFFEVLRKFSIGSRRKIDQMIESHNLEGVTILRPLKGIDPEMELCLCSCFEQDYPTDKLEIIFCVQASDDPAIGIAQDIIKRYPHIDAKLIVDDPMNIEFYGPNPKVNNLAKGYKKAKYDILWILDSNVWARPDILKRSVFSLCNSLDNGKSTYNFATNKGRRVNLVHHVPLAVSSATSEHTKIGTKLDEMFLGTSHSKFYVSLNKVAVAPCVNGKSNLYRRSELDLAVSKMGDKATDASVDGKSGEGFSDAKFYSLEKGNGIRFFARYIGEDNMIGIALWDYCKGRTGMTGDCIVQPLPGGIKHEVGGRLLDYVTRRMRWLRVRKYMVLAATLLEPSTECFLCGLFGTFAVSVLFLGSKFNWIWFCFHIIAWFLTDYIHYHFLFHSVKEQLSSPPFFLKSSTVSSDPNMKTQEFKTFKQFIPIWIAREALAFPIWFVAIIGSEINWRGQYFRINADLSAERL